MKRLPPLRNVSLALEKKRFRPLGSENLSCEKLKKLDKVAYIRYASVYRSFEDIELLRIRFKRITLSQIQDYLLFPLDALLLRH
jgi:transcriptional regulator NrdR family protein